MRYISVVLFSFAVSFSSQAKLVVVTTTTTLKNLVEEVGRDRVSVISLTKSTQDPHFVEAKPSYMVKLRKADMLVEVGLDLEVGWIGNVQRGAKNPVIINGGPGFFSAGDYVKAIEVPKLKVDRSQGDVHPYGNPHFHLDPNRIVTVVQALGKKLSKLDPASKEFYQNNADHFANKIKSSLPGWHSRVELSKVKNVVTYHKSLNYFLTSFGLHSVSSIEPHPGIPPTAKHIIGLIRQIRQEKVRCILNESYFETTAGERLRKETGAVLQVVPVEVQTDYFELIEALVHAVEECGKGAEGV
ncbi:MAG: zinc ABC transporter substrate-binding protein [Bdellovibrionales bacterium]|nr:zinc ABC transporter substrate-binding protein [Bdellovibrionales bacterium]